MEEQRAEVQVEQILRLLAQAQASRGRRRPVLSAGRDGITVGIRIKGCSIYEVAAVGTLSVYDRRGKRPGTVYLAQMPESGQGTLSTQLTELLVEVLRKWQGPLPRLCYVTAAALRSRIKPIGERLKEFMKAYKYLQTRRDHLRYAEYRRVGMPIGSGVSEAACKTVFTQRLKLSGMRWQKIGAM